MLHCAGGRGGQNDTKTKVLVIQVGFRQRSSCRHYPFGHDSPSETSTRRSRYQLRASGFQNRHSARPISGLSVPTESGLAVGPFRRFGDIAGVLQRLRQRHREDRRGRLARRSLWPAGASRAGPIWPWPPSYGPGVACGRRADCFDRPPFRPREIPIGRRALRARRWRLRPPRKLAGCSSPAQPLPRALNLRCLSFAGLLAMATSSPIPIISQERQRRPVVPAAFGSPRTRPRPTDSRQGDGRARNWAAGAPLYPL